MVVKQILASFRVPHLSRHPINGNNNNTTNNNNGLVKETKLTTEDEVIGSVSELLQTLIGVNEKPVLSTNSQGFGRLLMYEDGNRSQCTVRVLPEGLVTIDIMFNMDQIDDKSNYDILQIFYDLKPAMIKRGLNSSEIVAPLSRGLDIRLTYSETSDGRLKEYDFDKVVYEGSSEYQDVLILHSPQYGNMLFLDDNEMLAESDIEYTRALLGSGKEDYKDKTILILGGGDGGMIHEVLKEDPKFVTMVEIDQLVIDVSRKYLRNICGSTMDNLKGSNYEIIVDDCYKILRNYIEEGTVFDYVFNDLTDIPIGADGDEESGWTFIKDVLDLSLKVLDKNGKYYAQGTNGANNRREQQKYEDILSTYPIEYAKSFTFVPSFLELWTFYEIWKTDKKLTIETTGA